VKEKQKTPKINKDVLAGIPEKHPHEEFVKMDTEFKKRRGAKN